MLLQQLRGEITRPKIDIDQIIRYIDWNLNIAGNRLMDSAWRHLDSIYKTGLSNAQGTINVHTSVVSSYSKADQNRTDDIIDACHIAIEKQNQKLKADIIKQVEKGDQSVNGLLQSVRDQILQQFIPSVVTTAQGFAGVAYNEAVWSRISRAAPAKKWCFVSDYLGNEYHKSINDIEVDITQPFVVPAFEITKTKDAPEVEMMYPHDTTNKPHPLHLNDCRCYVEAVF